ncbi:MAG TPA: GNAT family N-acetyltransferase [Chitinophagaceae bacterium]|nr:GNAT family N-acetyltransferase [Chitinophagaceae bacterium]
MNDIIWQCKSFSELTAEEIYRIIQLRIEVFAVEQNVVYQDCDNKDLPSHHLTGWYNENLIAYSRLLPPGLAYKNAASIGRVVCSPAVRKLGIGRMLMAKSIEQIYQLFGNCSIIISAQLYLKDFYSKFSFAASGDPYIEDSIPHVRMEKHLI